MIDSIFYSHRNFPGWIDRVVLYTGPAAAFCWNTIARGMDAANLVLAPCREWINVNVPLFIDWVCSCLCLSNGPGHHLRYMFLQSCIQLTQKTWGIWSSNAADAFSPPTTTATVTKLKNTKNCNSLPMLFSVRNCLNGSSYVEKLSRKFNCYLDSAS